MIIIKSNDETKETQIIYLSSLKFRVLEPFHYMKRHIPSSLKKSQNIIRVLLYYSRNSNYGL
jgi:hypothetical protein